MAKWKAYYAKKEDFPDDMPEEIRKLYVSRNGRYEFDYADFEDLDGLSNPGLEANRDKWKREKEQADTALTEEKQKREAAEKELGNHKKPGMVSVPQAEYDQLKEYQKLGPVADVEKQIEENKDLKEQVENTTKEKERAAFCKDANLDPTALEDFMALRGDGIDKLFTKKTQIADPKDKSGKKKIDYNEPWVEITVKKDGKEKTEEYPLKKYMTEVNKVSDYLVNAVFTPSANSSTGQTNTQTGQNSQQVVIPDESTGRVSDDGTKPVTSPVKERNKKFIAENSTRRKPWEQKQTTEQ